VKEDLVDHRQFQDPAAKILEIGAVVEKLPEQVRFQAFDLLAAYASATGTPTPGKGDRQSQATFLPQPE
jgi:hypothetical protein